MSELPPSPEPSPAAAPTVGKPLNYLSPAPNPRRSNPAFSPREMEEARWAATFSLGTFRLFLMPLLILIFILWMVICVLFLNN